MSNLSLFLIFLFGTPFIFTAWVFFVCFFCWLFGMKISVKMPDGSKIKYRWFKRVS